MDAIFRLLADIHRRRPLVALLDHDPQSDGSIMVPEDVHERDQTLQRLLYELIHNSLPMLQETEAIRWDRETHHAHTGPRFEEIRPLLELLNDSADDLPGEWVYGEDVSCPYRSGRWATI